MLFTDRMNLLDTEIYSFLKIKKKDPDNWSLFQAYR